MGELGRGVVDRIEQMKVRGKVGGGLGFISLQLRREVR